MMTDQSTYEKILCVAESIVRSRGYNAFSYADIAKELGVTKASLHHHFPAKSDLGLQLVKRFTQNVLAALKEIGDMDISDFKKLEAYAGIYEGALEENKMCLCGMLAAEHETLTPEMQASINEFFDAHEAWVEEVLTNGHDTGEIDFNGSSIEHAKLIVSNLQGALLVAKSKRSMDHISMIKNNLFTSYQPRELAVA